MPGIAKHARLLTPKAFDRVFKTGTRLAVGPLLVVLSANALTHPRLGFALAKRHAKTAVQRNRIRRQLRERFRLSQAELAGVDLVITLRGVPSKVRAEEAVAVEAFWQKVHRRCLIGSPLPVAVERPPSDKGRADRRGRVDPKTRTVAVATTVAANAVVTAASPSSPPPDA